MKYLVYPESRDGVQMPLFPESMTLAKLAKPLERRMAAYEAQGYFSNANMERIPLGELALRLVPEEAR